MVWRRLPTYLPSFPLRVAPVTAAAREAGESVRELVFKTVPRVGKVREREGVREGGGGEGRGTAIGAPAAFFFSPPHQPTLPSSSSRST